MLLTSADVRRPQKGATTRGHQKRKQMEADELEPPLPPPPPPQPIIEEDEGERMCRYCFDGEEEGELIAPCACKGGQRWVHLECLREVAAHGFSESTDAPHVSWGRLEAADLQRLQAALYL